MSKRIKIEGRVHPMVHDLAVDLQKHRISRRHFLRTASLLGLSAASAYALLGKITGEYWAMPVARAAMEPRMGGTLRVSMPVQEMTDPALFDWVEKSNVARNIVEYLTVTGPDNVTRPYLAEKWEASDDLTDWTFHLHKGIKWNNGDDFTADDVAFNFNRWLDPATGSSNIGLFSAMTEEYDTGKKDENGKAKMSKRAIDGAVNVVDAHTIKLHMKTPQLAIPENCYNYPTAICHPKFDGNLMANPIGTGPYTLAEHTVKQRAVLKKRKEPYWGKDLSNPYIGGPIYLDEIVYIDHGSASAAQLAAYASGQVDSIYEFDIASLQMAQSLPNTTIYEAKTAQTVVARMQVDKAPFDNPKLRQAMQACIDVDKYPELVYGGRGEFAEHHHVAQIHPEYYKLPKPKRDVEKAKKLLEESGHGNGIDLSIDVGNTNGPWQQQVCEIMKQQLASIGVNLSLNVMPASKYWEIWDKTPFGLTAWTHRPLGTMVLSLGYRSGVPWNESHYANPAFDKALDEAEALLDVDARREKMKTVESILQGDAVIMQPLWQPKFFVANKKVHNMTAHPTQYHQFHRVWIEA
ncbi:MAG: ABC transporter substrate-binding protein [Arenicellales bacterium]|jgi:peptide/nickel transport system substrate-binding protein